MAHIEISIVTVTLNDETGIKRTLSSVQNLISSESMIEHIIIDGNSKDGTLRYAYKIADTNGNIKIYSEPDTGIYNAMNKGVSKANGRYVIFINSGDELLVDDPNKILEICMNASCNHYSLVCCAYQYYNIKTKKLRQIKARFTSLYFPRMPTSHQAMIYERQHLLAHRFDESFRVSGDFEHFCRLLSLAKSWTTSTTTLVRFYSGGVSSLNRRGLFLESSKSIQKYSKMRILVPLRIIVLWVRIFLR